MIFENQYSYVLKLFFNLLLPNGTIWCRIAKNFDFKIRKHQGKNFLIAPRLWVGCPLEFISSDISQNLTENVSGSNGLGYWSIFGSAWIWCRYFYQIWKVISILKNIRDSNRSHSEQESTSLRLRLASEAECLCSLPRVRRYRGSTLVRFLLHFRSIFQCFLQSHFVNRNKDQI